jgi:polyphosphate kinase
MMSESQTTEAAIKSLNGAGRTSSRARVLRHAGHEKPSLKSPDRFFNRELSWLDFNIRVLEEAANPNHPLLERLRFLSISASNLDEFFMVRYAGLREQMRQGITSKSQDGLTPSEQVDRIRTVSNRLMKAQQKRWDMLREEMRKEGIEVVRVDELDDEDRAALKAYFDAELFPIITPLSVDPIHPFPFIPNLGFAMAFTLAPEDDDNRQMMTGLVPMPTQMQRFVALPEDDPGRLRFIAVEEVIGMFVSDLYPGYREAERCLFRVVRDSDIEIEEEAEDLIREFEILLNERKRGKIVRIKIDNRGGGELQDLILREIEADPGDVVTTNGMLGIAQLSELITKQRPDLTFTPYEPRFPERIREFGGDIFAAIRHKDMVVHHPYESFDVVVQFIGQAARDPNVVAIKQTLYRTSKDSPVVEALIEAAEAGKNVTALVEIKARFDEEANLRWARDLERVGAKVVYGFVDYKTHAKVSLVVRREEGELRYYTHFGTGNYHPITARLYTDLSLFTADNAFGRDAQKMFNFITGNRELPSVAPDFERISMSPKTLESDLVRMIEAEARNQKAGKPSGIWAKMNSLVDNDIIDALYRASQAGVPITLVIRGICCLRPGIEGLSETISVKSIVGRFLEHSRICCFGNGHQLPSSKAKVFISSADWMQRNLKRRVESLVPVLNPTVHRQVLHQIMVANINDDTQSWVLEPDGRYKRLKPPTKGKPFSSHEYFMSAPSYSGAGRSLEVNMPPKLTPRKRSVK